MRLRSYIKDRAAKKSRGFTILEVLVTAAIVGIITAVVAFKYGSFNNAVLLKNQAYEIALDIREAQVIAVSALGQETGPETREFREDYGLYFSTASDLQKQQYLMFQDRGELIENGQNTAYYDVAPNEERIGLPRALDTRFSLSRICVNIASESNKCPYEVTDLSVSFKRPNFDTQFASVDANDKGIGAINNARLEIINASDTAGLRTVVVNNTGQIYVE